MHPPGSDYTKIRWQSIQDSFNATIAFYMRKLPRDVAGGGGCHRVQFNALRRVHSPRPARSRSKQSGSHAQTAWKSQQLRIQDNRFQEYLMKSLQ